MKLVYLLLGALTAITLTTGLWAQQPDQWPNYQHNSNYSPLTQITPENVGQLEHAWTFNYGAGSLEDGGFVGLDYRFQVQPLLIGGVMYFSTPTSERVDELSSTVTALEPETGEVIWQYRSPRGIHGRGIAYWQGNDTVGPRLFFATDKGYLMGLDIETGQLAEGFGTGGEVDVYSGVASPEVGESRRDTYTVPNPVTVYKDLLITGARPGEQPPPQPRGDIRAWSAVTGEQVWEFHVVPQPGEPNHEDWPEDTWQDRSGCNVWSNLTADESTGLVFGATGDANRRGVPGKNLYCNSILALDGETGELAWFFQLIHHDAADYDMPTPPILVDIQRGDQVIPAVLQTGKIHLAFIFDRVTGEPIYGVEERSVGRALGDADDNWPTQPIPVMPAPTGRMSMTRDDINKMTPEIEEYCTNFWDANNLLPSGPYDRPTDEEAMVTFGAPVGGWGPLSYDQQLGYVFLNVTNSGRYNAAADTAQGGFGEQFSYRLPSGVTVPCMEPPYGALTAVNVGTGEIVWSVPLGINEELAELGEVGLKSGIRNIGGSIATASGLVFIGATVDQKFRAFDALTGEELWVTDLPANGNATPMTYMGSDGAQYVVIAAAGGGPAARGQKVSDALMAFKLPE